MTFPYSTPILGILNEVEKPGEFQVVVVFGKPSRPRWSYVTTIPHRDHGDYDYREPHLFTPLKQFGVEATLRPDGKLALHQINISTAKYPDGKPRRWQGSTEATVAVQDRVAGFVMRAVHAEFEARRSKARASA